VEQVQQKLPNTWTVLDRISSLEDDQFQKALKQGVINPLATRASIDAFKKAEFGEQAPEKTDQPDNAYRIASIWLDKSKASAEVVEQITKRLADKLKKLESEISAGELLLTDHGVAERLKPSQKQVEKETARRKRNEEKALRILAKAVKKVARLHKENTKVHQLDFDLKEAINCQPDYETVQAAISRVQLKVNLDECIENPELAEEFYKKMVEREKKGLPVL
jgi:gas vesicle protein